MTAKLKPFSVLVLAPFAPVPDSHYKPHPVCVDPENPDTVMEEIGPSLYFPVDKEIVPAGYVEFSLSSFQALSPDGLPSEVPFLQALVDARDYVKQAMAGGEDSENIYQRLLQWPDLRLRFESAAASQSGQSGGGVVDDILSMVDTASAPSADAGGPQGWLDQMDHALKFTIAQIIRNNDFRRYESAWRGLRLLIDQMDSKQSIEVFAAPVSKACLEESLESLLDSYTDVPPSLVLIDLSFDSSPRDLEILEKVGEFAENIMAPAIVSVSEQFFHLGDWDDLDTLSYLPNHFEKPVYAKFNRLKTLNCSHWLCVTCNEFLLRPIYGKGNPAEICELEEYQPLWGSPVWACGALMLQSISSFGLPTRMSDDRSVGLNDLAVFRDDNGRPKCSRMVLSEDRFDQFIRSGIMPLQADARSQRAWFVNAVTAGISPLADQLMFSLIVGQMLYCKTQSGQGDLPAQIESMLRETFEQFWLEAGYDPPGDMEISVFEPEPGAAPVANVMMTPPREALPSGRRIELGFQW